MAELIGARRAKVIKALVPLPPDLRPSCSLAARQLAAAQRAIIYCGQRASPPTLCGLWRQLNNVDMRRFITYER